MSVPDGTSRFLEAVNHSPRHWQSVDLRILAVFAGDQWRNLASLVRLRAEDPKDVPRLAHLPSSAHIRCWQEIRRLSDLPDVLSEAATGSITIGADRIAYLRNQFDPMQAATPYGPPYYSFIETGRAFRSVCAEWPIHELLFSGDRCQDLLGAAAVGWQGLDNELRVLSRPLDLDRLAKLILDGPRNWSLHSDSAPLWVVAPIETRFERERCDLEAGKLRLRIFASSKSMTYESSVGLFGDGFDGQLIQQSDTLGDTGWHDAGSGLAYEYRHDLSGADRVICILRVGNLAVEHIELVDHKSAGKNLRALVYETFDPELEKLLEALHPPGKPEKGRFEAAVARLLWLCGFAVDNVGGAYSISDAVDIVAHAPLLDTLLLVECTVQAVDTGGKIGKFVNRLETARKSLGGHQVLGLLVTAMAEPAIDPSELETARNAGLSVLGLGGLDALIEMALHGSSLDNVIGFIRAKSL